MKQKILLIAIIIIAVLAIGFYYYQNQAQKSWVTFTDNTNKITFQANKDWTTTSNDKFVTSAGNGTTVLITTNPIDVQIEGLGLNNATETIKLGDNEFKVLHKDFTIDSKSAIPEIKKYTYLLLQNQNTKYLFEISPQQKSGFDENTQKLLKTFKSF